MKLGFSPLLSLFSLFNPICSFFLVFSFLSSFFFNPICIFCSSSYSSLPSLFSLFINPICRNLLFLGGFLVLFFFLLSFNPFWNFFLVSSSSLHLLLQWCFHFFLFSFLERRRDVIFLNIFFCQVSFQVAVLSA